MFDFLLSLNIISSYYMLGIIWLIQLIHYPAFRHINTEKFDSFHKQHTLVLGLLVGPAMIIELLTAILILVYSAESSLIYQINLFIVIALWLLTFVISVPIHNKLALGFDMITAQRLIQTNWPRTGLWTIRSALMTYSVLNTGVI